MDIERCVERERKILALCLGGNWMELFCQGRAKGNPKW